VEAAMIVGLLRRVWSLAWLLVLLAGVPAGLVRLVGWPLPDHWPTNQEWQVWLDRPLTRTTLLDGAAIIGWLLWALLVYAVVVEILTRARRVVRAAARLRLPALPSPLQATASGMLGAAVFGMPTGSAHPPAPPAAPPPAPAALLPATADAPVAVAEPDGPAVQPVLAGHPTVGERHPDLRGRGVALPDGGWITDQTAHAIAAAAAVVWWRRRHDYLPRPPTGTDRDDADLAPLPPTVTTAQDVLHGRERPDDGPEDTDDAAHDGGVAPAGDRAGRPIGLGDLPPGGVGLTGTGAYAAARGIVAAVLLSAGPWQHPGDPQLITTAADLDTLLGPAAAGYRATPGLTMVDNLDDAITLLEQHILTRARLIGGRRPAADHQAPPDAGFPPVVLLTRGPADHVTAVRLAVLLLGTHLGITGALLGGWPHGQTWWVDEDGHTHTADTTAPTAPVGARLCVLTPTAAADLLTLLRQARPDPHHPSPPEPSTPPPQPVRPAVATATSGRAPVPPRPRAPHPPGAAAPDGPATGPAPLRLILLGTPALHRTEDAGAPVPIQRTAALQILIFLAVHRRGAVSNQLIAALWPGPRPDGAAERLYTPISKLRATLRAAAGADVLIRDGDRYRLDERHIEADLWRLHTAIDRAATAVDPAERRRALRAVVDAYTGDLAAGKDWAWLATPREATRRHVVDAYVALASDEPDPHAALALLQDAVRVDPVNADLHRRAQHAHTRAAGPPQPQPASNHGDRAAPPPPTRRQDVKPDDSTDTSRP
jgi:DNA-binding SARP family transcriptional activator